MRAGITQSADFMDWPLEAVEKVSQCICCFIIPNNGVAFLEKDTLVAILQEG
ncbi:MAG: hypothetical protein PHS40_02540 [Mariniphaga sp.]|nr:hypothetical protein [Mariniphaga sp.]MDD4424783.1 hypothetical protein [Mariniphaga sp.]